MASVTCSTLYQTLLHQTLRTSTDEQLRQNRMENCDSFQDDSRGGESPAAGTHVEPNQEPVHFKEWELCSWCRECHDDCGLERKPSSRSESRTHRSRRKNRGERPNSLPPLYLRSTIHEMAEEPGSGHNDGASPTEDVPIRQRSRSHENCYFYKCQDNGTAEMEPVHRRTKRQCECGQGRGDSRCSHCEGLDSSSSSCSSGSNGHRRRRSARPTARSREDRVDPSIDDNCPRRLENRIRRKPRHAAACDECKTKRKQQRHSPERNSDVNLDQHEPDVEYVDLAQLKTLALLESVALRLTQEGNNDDSPTDFRRHRKLRNKHHSINLEDMPRLRATIKLDDNHLNDLLHPKQIRTGRDSPRTDMAVCSLDMSGPHMFVSAARTDVDDQHQRLYRNQCLSVSDSSLSRHQILPLNAAVADGPGGSTDMTVIHQHHHFHHIVHHSQP